MGDLTKNLSRSEFQCNCGHCPPPVVDFVTVNVIQDSANHFARKLGVNKVVVNIHSGHRCAWWNGKEGGVRGSNHVDCEAVDFDIEGVSCAELAEYLRSTYPNQYGIGEYETFVHFDIGAFRRWKG